MCFICTALRFKNHRLVGKIRTMEHFEIAAHVNSVLGVSKAPTTRQASVRTILSQCWANCTIISMSISMSISISIGISISIALVRDEEFVEQQK